MTTTENYSEASYHLPNEDTVLGKGLQFHAAVTFGKLAKKLGFFFPGTPFFYASLNNNGNHIFLKDAVCVQFMRNPKDIHAVNYIFFSTKKNMKAKPSYFVNNNFSKKQFDENFESSPFLILSHPDYCKEIKPGVYVPPNNLTTEEYQATAVMAFLGILQEIETLKHFTKLGFDVGKANIAENIAVPHKENNTNLPSFAVWQTQFQF